MLTRLEVDGFKNLLDLTITFGPYTCIAGPNGVGKSNIFDAIRFLSLLADHTLVEAALGVRASEAHAADPRHLFWTDGHERADRMRLAAEMIVPREVRDDFNRKADTTSTFLRYELELGYEEPSGGASLGRLVLLREALRPITAGDAPQHLPFPHSASAFRNRIVDNKRRAKSGFISTEPAPDGRMQILVHQDQGTGGRPAPAPADSAPRTIVGTTTTSQTPTILAARREMQSWRLLALEPSAMRRPDRFMDDPHITPNGGHLPATLYRLASQEGAETGAPPAVYARVAARLSDLMPVEEVRVDRDEARERLTLEARESGRSFLPALALSDGTLRFLTLCILEQDPEVQGVICMEEPENGIHPVRMKPMVQLLRDLAVDPHEPPGADNPLRQVIVNTHSPLFVQLQDPSDLLYAEQTRVKLPSGRATTTLRCRPLLEGAERPNWRLTGGGIGVGKATIIAYLTQPRGAQIALDDAVELEKGARRGVIG